MADEANQYKRWKDEFARLFKHGRIIILFGSAARNYAKANDIDLLTVIDKNDYEEVNSTIKEKQAILPKKIHPLIMSKDDLANNIRENNGATHEIVKTGIVLYGQDAFVEVLKNVTAR